MTDDTHTCDECGEKFRLSELIVLNAGERVVCFECSDPTDRII